MPRGLNLTGGAKESHKKELYCVVWSTDVHGDDPIHREEDGNCSSPYKRTGDAAPNVSDISLDDLHKSDLNSMHNVAGTLTASTCGKIGLAEDRDEGCSRKKSLLESDEETTSISSSSNSNGNPCSSSDDERGLMHLETQPENPYKIGIGRRSSFLDTAEESEITAIDDAKDKFEKKRKATVKRGSNSKSPKMNKGDYGGRNRSGCNPYEIKRNLSRYYYMATCGGQHLTIYQVKMESSHGNYPVRIPSSSSSSSSAAYSLSHDQNEAYNSDFQVRQVYHDSDEGEIFYTCVFAGRSQISGRDSKTMGTRMPKDGNEFTIEESSVMASTHVPHQRLNKDEHEHPIKYGHQMCCVAGKRGIIKVINTAQQSLVISLIGHTDSIYDMKRCPTNEWLMISASNDQTIRLWNLMHPTCIAVFAGHQGHREAVLSVDWHPLGDYFVSSGMDGTIKMWSCEDKKIQRAVRESFIPPDYSHGLPGYAAGVSTLKEPISKCNDTPYEGIEKKTLLQFRTVFQQLPFYSTSKLHTDYVDCVAFVGDLILSKSVNNIISLWKPLVSTEQSKNDDVCSPSPLSSKSKNEDFVHLQDYAVPECRQWFVRFGLDGDCHLLGVGNCIGDLRVWEIGGARKKPHYISNSLCTSIVRMVSFSPDGKIMVAACDDATVWKYNILHDYKVKKTIKEEGCGMMPAKSIEPEICYYLS